VTTGNCRGAGTDANVFATLYGPKRDSGKHSLEGTGNLFERGKTDKFNIQCVDLGKLKRLRIGHDGTGLGDGWFLEDVKVESSAGGKWTFPCTRWLATNEGDKLIVRELAVDGEPGPPVVHYKIKVVTGRKRGSGTGANVYCNLVGANGRIDNISLEGSKNNFETGHVGDFNVHGLDIGDIKQFDVWHDNSGLGPGWFLDRVYVELEESKQKWMFPCGKWLDKSEDDGKIKRTLTPGTAFVVKLATGKDRGAGTDDNVYCKIHSNTASTDEIHLSHSEHHNKFEAGQVDTFSFGSKVLGPITHITIRTVSTGLGSDWELDHLSVLDEYSGQLVKASCGVWFNETLTEKQFPLS